MSYVIIGHFHGKRSVHVTDPNIGERWREFLWQNLLGDCFPMMDTILDYFAEFESVGLVFADDPHLSDWDLNRDIAEDLAQKCGMRLPLPPSLDFPIGTMFWARSQALERLFALGLKWKDYPAEPIPIDGTILHAIERLLPFVARHAGYRYATTHIPGIVGKLQLASYRQPLDIRRRTISPKTEKKYAIWREFLRRAERRRLPAQTSAVVLPLRGTAFSHSAIAASSAGHSHL
jgi:lipopolysaccharide biosynthesis protein